MSTFADEQLQTLAKRKIDIPVTSRNDQEWLIAITQMSKYRRAEMPVQIGNFEQIKKLGEGTFGEVFKVKATVDFSTKRHTFEKDKEYALKTFRGPFDDGIPQDAVKELDTLNRVNHKNVLCAFQSIDLESCTGIGVVLPLAETNFWEYIKDRKDIVPKDQPLVPLNLLYQVVCGLYYLHSNNIVHDDLKPHNILLFENKTVAKIADYGLINILAGRDDIVNTSQTDWWRPPELLEDPSRPHGYESDMWALGIIFFQAVTRKEAYFAGADEEDTLDRIKKYIIPGRWKERDDYFVGQPAGIKELMSRMLDSDPKTRITVEQAINDPIFAQFSCDVEKIEPISWNLDNVLPFYKEHPRYRKVVVKWIFEVSEEFKTGARATFLAIDIFDRYVSSGCEYQRSTLQLIAAAAMSLASKLIDKYPPTIGDYAWMTAGTFSKTQIIEMECKIFKCLGWIIYRPPLNVQIPDASFEKLKKCYMTNRALEDIKKCLQ